MSNSRDMGLDGFWDHGEFTITCTRLPRPDLKDSFWSLYEESFGPLRVRAVARQVLTESEFAAELSNPRIWKYIARDAHGRPAGLTTVTDDVSTLPWISPEYFEHQYPEEWSRQAVFYVGVTLVRPDMRRDRVWAMMATYVAQRVAEAGGVLGYDICGHNDQDRFLGRATAKLLPRVAPFSVGVVDVQTYYVARLTETGAGATRD